MSTFRSATYKKEDGTLGLIRCPICGTENYALAVSSGICYACGFDVNKQEKNDD